MVPDYVLLVGAAAILVAVLLVLFVSLRPSYQDIDVSRRRPSAPDTGTQVTAKPGGATVSAAERRAGRAGGGIFGLEALNDAGITSKPSEFSVLILIGSLVTGLMGFLLHGFILAVVFAFLSPLAALLIVKVRTGRRRTAFGNQLSDMLLALSGSLRAGHGITQSLQSASLEMPAPMSQELARIVNENRVGRPVSESMADVGRRMQCEDFEWLSQAIEINREVGGDLAGVLDHVGETVRERAQIKGQVRALAAEGKFSAYILIALPFVVAGFLNIANPGYMAVLTQSLLGWVFIVLGVIMMAIGSFWISRMVKIEF
ncbi:type II secretion system F family protein [Paenarthrobacter sp. AR 02]|uniref:type II secretion system F family protein n=1 Tax=Paenarthrobacter sp. AR 02 TaxID=2899821 RepID=UPI001F4073B2|nr:type II secretion system F family protein [Paenarthrobacter sp. AR 02]MCF3137757.1 type II secretion system F family protein [Paenarthrobacter sp. AR 02]